MYVWIMMHHYALHYSHRHEGCSVREGSYNNWMIRWYGIFVNCNWVNTRWQQYSTHLHTNNT